MSSWDPRWLASARSVAAWDQLSIGDTWYTWDGVLVVHPGNWEAGTREVIKMHSPPGTVRLPSTQSPQLLGPGKDTKCISQLGLSPLQSSWEPKQLRPRKSTECRAHLGQCPCRKPWSLNSVDLWSTCHLGLWQTQRGTNTVSPLSHTPVTFVCSVPPSPQHNWTSAPK